MAEFQDQAAGNLVLRLTRLRQRTATGGPGGPAPLTAEGLSACSSAADVNTGGTETISYLQNQKAFRSTLRHRNPPAGKSQDACSPPSSLSCHFHFRCRTTVESAGDGSVKDPALSAFGGH